MLIHLPQSLYVIGFALIFNFFFLFFTNAAMEGVYTYFGAVHFGAGIVGFEGKLGYVSCIASVDPGQFGSHDMQK